MIITYNGEKLRYVADYYGEPVLWITKHSQISMEHMKFVGGYPDEYSYQQACSSPSDF